MAPAQSQSDHQAAVVPSHPLAHGDGPVLIANPKARLFDQVREVLRFHHYSLRTEEVYLQWIKRYLVFHRRPLTPTLSPSEGATEKRRRPLAPALATAPEHLIRPVATFSPSDAEKDNPMGEGGVEHF